MFHELIFYTHIDLKCKKKNCVSEEIFVKKYLKKIQQKSKIVIKKSIHKTWKRLEGLHLYDSLFTYIHEQTFRFSLSTDFLLSLHSDVLCENPYYIFAI